MSSPPKTKMTVKSLFIRPFFFDQPLYQYYMRSSLKSLDAFRRQRDPLKHCQRHNGPEG